MIVLVSIAHAAAVKNHGVIEYGSIGFLYRRKLVDEVRKPCHMVLILTLAAVALIGVCAGNMESSNGKATATPAPRRNVRRERCFFVMKFIALLLLCLLDSHLKGLAVHYTQNYGRKTIVVPCGIPRDGSD